ncbi:UDP-glucuronosyltransferase-like isoform X2 [Brachyhypopomus gauderio]|uniref:UDP-glucuronosyltransferase-like isoform X2 n=1 Tax=Brachyhypopomus gauderio TaxID=698409 RepID=UPI0040421911
MRRFGRGMLTAQSAAALGLLTFLCGIMGVVHGGKVLVMPVDGSHWLSLKLLVEELSHRGHEVVVLVPETNFLIRGANTYTTLNFKDTSVNKLKEGVMRTQKTSDLLETIRLLLNLTNMYVKSCEGLYDEVMMKSLREYSFDLMLTDPLQPCGPIIAEAFSLPVVYFLRGLPCELDMRAVQAPSPPAFIPRFFTKNTDVMDFPQRVKNALMAMVELYICQLMFGGFDELSSQYLKKDVTYEELLRRGAIWLLRSDFSFEYPRPQMPNMVMIGGINCAKMHPLSGELQEFVNGSGEHGFVVFTLGSMVSELPEVKTRQFLEAFRHIPQKVVWRYTGTLPKDIPKNIKVMKWLPQNDLLAHPKAKAFITHGGTHSIYEGICNGVPMVTIPLFGDQADNVQRMVVRGVAERVNIFDMTSEKLLVALKKVINDKSYKEKIMKLSVMHRDRPIEPLDLAVYWTEYVMRHKGAEHLRPAAHELNWIQYHSLDVFAFLLFILVTVIYVTVKSCVFCFKKCFGIRQKKKKE